MKVRGFHNRQLDFNQTSAVLNPIQYKLELTTNGKVIRSLTLHENPNGGKQDMHGLQQGTGDCKQRKALTLTFRLDFNTGMKKKLTGQPDKDR